MIKISKGHWEFYLC